MTLWWYRSLCAGTCARPLTLMSRPDATVFGFVPDVILNVDSTANSAFVIGFVNAGIGILLDFWY